jgi:hypothetical protein
LHEENKKRQSEKKDAYKRLCDITNITSGSLAANNALCISQQEILNHTIEKAARVKQKAQDAQERQEATKIRDNLAFAASFNKYKMNKKLLTKDYKNILKKIHRMIHRLRRRLRNVMISC